MEYFFSSIGKKRLLTAPKSRTVERPVLLCKQTVVCWLSMASHRPKLPLEIRTDYVCCGLLTGQLLMPHSIWMVVEDAAQLFEIAAIAE